jgi:hypothetical protein
VRGAPLRALQKCLRAAMWPTALGLQGALCSSKGAPRERAARVRRANNAFGALACVLCHRLWCPLSLRLPELAPVATRTAAAPLPATSCQSPRAQPPRSPELCVPQAKFVAQIRSAPAPQRVELHARGAPRRPRRFRCARAPRQCPPEAAGRCTFALAIGGLRLFQPLTAHMVFANTSTFR